MTDKPGNHGHKARKRFGQNFLQDARIIERIIGSISPQPGQQLVEIGPGLGAITEGLLAGTDGHLNVVELDRDLIPRLQQRFGHLPGFVINEGDALAFDYSQLLSDTDNPLRLVGNLPYNISTPLIFHLLTFAGQIQDMHFMLQKEVVNRMAAEPGSKSYGRLGIMVQYFCQVDSLFLVPPAAFDPRPKVDSAIVRLTPHSTLPHPAQDHNTLKKVVQAAFSQRRKTIRNTLKPLINSAELEILGIDSGLRAENLSLADYVAISDHVFNQATAT